MENSEIDVSVIICYRFRLSFLTECLKGLAAQDSDSFEVLVVDQGYEPDARQIVNEYGFNYLALDDPLSPFHRGWACNVGAKHSRGKLLCFLDCDCVVTPDFVSFLQKILKKQHDDRYFLRMTRKWLEEKDTVEYFSKKLSFQEAFAKCDIDPNVTAVGSGTCVPRSTFHKIAGFDEKYDQGWGFEDVDLYDRMIAYKCKVLEGFDVRQMHLWHSTDGHKREHRGEHYHYYKRKARIKKRGMLETFIFRNLSIDWGSVPRDLPENFC